MPIPNPLESYRRHVEQYVITQHGLTAEDSIEFTEYLIKENLVDPSIEHYHRPSGEDTEFTKLSFLSILNDARSKGRTISPSGVVYENKDVRLSFVTVQLYRWLKERSIIKKESFISFMKGLLKLAGKQKRGQLTLKGYANSVSGLVTSTSIVHCKSMHTTFTSTTAMSTSIANTCNERYLAGNIHLRTVQITLSYIVTVITETDVPTFIKMMDKFDIHYPTINETYTSLKDSFGKYFTAPVLHSQVMDLIEKLTPIQCAIVTYHGSLYRLREYNPDLVFDILHDMLEPSDVLTEDPVAYLASVEEDVRVTAHHTKFSDLKGVLSGYKDKDDNPIDPKVVEELAKIPPSINKGLKEYDLLFQVLFHNEIAPPSPVFVRDMVRHVVILSDTDSTCITLEEWVDWYTGMDKQYTYDKSLGVMSLLGLVSCRSLTNYVDHYSRCMGIREEDVGLIEFKNEFSWNVFIRAAEAAKHYVAGTLAVEGNIYPDTVLEKKGVNLIGASQSKYILDAVYDISTIIINTLLVNGTVDKDDIIEKARGIIDKFITDIEAGDYTHLKTMLVKSPEDYSDKNPMKSNYRYTTVWNELFGSLYTAGPNEYFAKYSLKITNKSTIEDFLTSYSEYFPDDVERVRLFFIEHTKKDLVVFPIPVAYLENNKLHPVITKYLDIDLMINNLTTPLNIIMAGIGIYVEDSYQRS